LPKRKETDSYRFSGFTWPRFTQVPNQTFAELMPRLSGAGFKVLMAIIHKVLYHGREEGYAPVGYAEIMELTGLHKDSVRRAVKECVDLGCVVVLEEYHAARCLSRMYGLKFAPGYGPQSTRRLSDEPAPDGPDDAPDAAAAPADHAEPADTAPARDYRSAPAPRSAPAHSASGGGADERPAPAHSASGDGADERPAPARRRRREPMPTYGDDTLDPPSAPAEPADEGDGSRLPTLR
jgi:hypothetical protein